MRVAVIAVVLFVWSPLAWGLDYEFGIPAKKIDGLSASVIRVVPEDCWAAFWLGSMCLQNGIVFADMKIKDGEDVRFLGVDTFAKFLAGPFWSRIGFGFGFFDRKTEEVRSRWDFNITSQWGFRWLNGIGVFVGLDHWSNGRSFASRLGLKNLWPEHNDGGNVMLVGLILSF